MTSTKRLVIEALEHHNPAALFADGLERAIVGYTLNHHSPSVVVYDYDKCVSVLVKRDGMTALEAEEFLSFNTLGAFVGQNGPVYIKAVGGCRR